MAIRGHEDTESNLIQLLELRSDDCPSLKVWLRERHYFSPVIVNSQIRLMGLDLLKSLLCDIRSAEIFSVVVDEATDVSCKEQMVVCIRWVDEDFMVHEDPVELIHLSRTDASTITSALKDCLLRFCLPLEQCRGQAYDGASNMSGYLNGVAAQIQKEISSAIYVHCLAHCTNLCLQTVGRQCTPVRDALDLVMELTQLIRYSPNEQPCSLIFKADLLHKLQASSHYVQHNGLCILVLSTLS